MGVPWHKQEVKSPKKEWVVYAAAGVVLLLVAGGITLGVVLGGKNKGGSDEQSSAQAEAAGGSTVTVPAQSATPSLPKPVPSTPSASPPPAAAPSPSPAPATAPVPSPPAAAPAVGSPPAAAVAAPPPPAQAPTATAPATPTPSPAPASAPPTAGAPPSSPAPSTSTGSTYDSTAVAPGTLDGPTDGRTSPSYEPPEIEGGKKGTCDFMADSRSPSCRDDMDFGSSQQIPIENLQRMWDSQMMETCGFTDMTQIVNSLVGWAYKKKCGVEYFTTARACVGKPGLADGYWRARVMLWPLPGGDPEVCVPLCIKMRGFQNQVTDYGRTGSC